MGGMVDWASPGEKEAGGGRGAQSGNRNRVMVIPHIGAESDGNPPAVLTPWAAA